MAKAKNKVVAGDFEGNKVSCSFGTAYLNFMLSNVALDKNSVESYEVLTDEHKKSAASGVARGAAGGILLGPAGIVAGALLAKGVGIYNLAINFRMDGPKKVAGKRCLIEIDEPTYKALVKKCF